MESRIEFNTKDIEYIRFTPVKKLDWEYHAVVPEIRVFFGIFRKRPKFTNKWIRKGYEVHYCSYYGWENMKSANSLREWGSFQKEEEGEFGPWYDKAEVYIQKRKSYHTAKFKSNEEAEEFIKDVKKMSGEKFKVITNG